MTLKFSFAVGSKYGPRSVRWNITAKGHDVVVDADNFSRRFHVTLHESGQWHIKKVRHSPGEPKTIIKLHRDEVPEGEHVVGLFVTIPDHCLRQASQPDKLPDPDLWLERPPYGGVVEIAIASWDFTGQFGVAPKEEWPGQKHGTVLRAAFAYPGAEAKTLGILTRHLDAEDPIAIDAEKRRPKVPPIILDSPERRGIIVGRTKGGAIGIQEVAID